MQDNNKSSKDQKLVEILDNQGQVLLHMPLSISIKQKLRRKIALVAAKNTDDKYILRRHSSKAEHNKGLWDITAYANVYANESCEEAALRELKNEYGIDNVHLKEIASMPYQNQNEIPLLAFVFNTSSFLLQEKRNRYYVQDKELMFVTQHELKELISQSPELFTTELIWASQAGWL